MGRCLVGHGLECMISAFESILTLGGLDEVLDDETCMMYYRIFALHGCFWLIWLGIFVRSSVS